jgi:hypothetical protein
MAAEGRGSGWNDQRTDEFAERTEENFREIRSEIGDLRAKIDRRSDMLAGATVTGFVSLIIAHFLG